MLNPFTGCDDQEAFHNPDAILSWDTVAAVQINIEHGDGAENQHNVCPICLDFPALPKITRCGHTFWYVSLAFTPCINLYFQALV